MKSTGEINTVLLHAVHLQFSTTNKDGYILIEHIRIENGIEYSMKKQ